MFGSLAVCYGVRFFLAAIVWVWLCSKLALGLRVYHCCDDASTCALPTFSARMLMQFCYSLAVPFLFVPDALAMLLWGQTGT